ncbi:MAG: stimulus-sensing domain-containing protein, partial [Kiloniellales bacterium]
VLLTSDRLRARVFDRTGAMLADSNLLSGPGGTVEVRELPAPSGERNLGERLERVPESLLEWLPGQGELPLYREPRQPTARDYPEVEKALQGNAAGRARSDLRGRLVLSAAVPVQRYRQVLGALMLSKDGAEIAAAVADRRHDVLVVFAIGFAVTVLLSLYLAGTIARPVRRLAEAAEAVRYGKGRRIRIPDLTKRADEIGDLSGALIEMTEALWQRLDAIEGFAADVAHEIKNPLTSLRSAVETASRIQDPEQQKKLMSIILDDVARLDRLISDISDASRLDAELSRAQTQPVDVAHLVHTLADVNTATGAFGKPRLAIDLPAHQDLYVAGIEDRLGQVLRNLLSNAATFSPPSGRIELAARREGPSVVITVSDQGPGIPEGKENAIFERFYSERPKDEKFGTHSGLGLSISRQIVEAHGGTLHAENLRKPDGRVAGARFVIRLPYGGAS